MSRLLEGEINGQNIKTFRVAKEIVRVFPSLSESQLLECNKASIGLRTQLQGLLQSTILQSNEGGRRGKLNTKKLHRLFVNDPCVFFKTGKKISMDTESTQVLI